MNPHDSDTAHSADHQAPPPGVSGQEPDWWERIGAMSWQHVVLSVAAIAGFVGLCFAPPATCSLHVDDSPTTTTTEAR